MKLTCPSLPKWILLLAVVGTMGLVSAEAPGAPRLSLKTLEGQALSPAHPGTVTELLFVARWCPPCEKAVAGARRRLGAFQRKGYRLIVVGTSRRQSLEQFQQWTSQMGLHGPLVYDAGGRAEGAFGAELLPWYVVIDAQGKILHSGSEPLPQAKLRTLIGRR